MANINFYGAEILDNGNLGELIDTTNTYMGEPVVSGYWKNGSETIANGDEIDLEAAQTNWANFDPKQATVTTIQDTIFRSAIDPENFGGSTYDCGTDHAHAAAEGCLGLDNHIWYQGNIVPDEPAADETH